MLVFSVASWDLILKVIKRDCSKSRIVTRTSLSISKKRNYQNLLVLKKVMTFLPQASNLCQDTSQCYHPVMLISYIGLVCDVITAIGLEKTPVL